MKREVMVCIMAIGIALGTRVARMGVGSGRLRKIRKIFFLMRPATTPTLILSVLFSNVG